jgi:hypothetical protein
MKPLRGIVANVGVTDGLAHTMSERCSSVRAEDGQVRRCAICVAALTTHPPFLLLPVAVLAFSDMDGLFQREVPSHTAKHSA